MLDRREGRLEETERRLRDLIASDRAASRHACATPAGLHELAQVLDRTDRFDEAMRLLAEAKDIVRALTDTELLARGYDQGAGSARRFTVSQPANILQDWAGFFPERKRSAIPRLAFLGGHPRSGTTLLEQILDAHPDVAALDEPAARSGCAQPEISQSPTTCQAHEIR